MGFEYALVHLKYTIPPALFLTFVSWPLFTRLDLYKVFFLIFVAVVSTIPWDAYLIHRRIWTYPPEVVIGATIFGIPAEEVFFFVIQTYNTSLLYLLLSKPIIRPAFLFGVRSQYDLKKQGTRGLGVLITTIAIGGVLVYFGREGTYLGLILIWAGPFALLLWSLSSDFLISLPFTNTIVPVLVPTLYLWLVDTLALRRGTWAIESGTKLGIYLWPGLEAEEAVFFLATNVLIVFGLVAFDNAQGVLEGFPALFPDFPSLPSPWLLISALLTPLSDFDEARIIGIQEAVARLRRKSRSFYLASSVFSGRLRIDLILLYSFCRAADDLVDNSSSESEARNWIEKLKAFLDYTYGFNGEFEKSQLQNSETAASNINHFPTSCQSALSLLPATLLSSSPFYELLDGFQTDLEFSIRRKSPSHEFPIKQEAELELYSRRVAGTIGQLCLELVFHHSHEADQIAELERQYLVQSGSHMGVALQYVNIARDIATDAAIGRVYIPIDWLAEENLRPEDVLNNPTGDKIEKLRSRILDKAFAKYEEAKSAIDQLPQDVRAPMRVAIESYMEIGRVIRTKGYTVKAGKATVPKIRRILVAWKALNEG